jgi:hypothetical protein
LSRHVLGTLRHAHTCNSIAYPTSPRAQIRHAACRRARTCVRQSNRVAPGQREGAQRSRNTRAHTTHTLHLQEIVREPRRRVPLVVGERGEYGRRPGAVEYELRRSATPLGLSLDHLARGGGVVVVRMRVGAVIRTRTRDAHTLALKNGASSRLERFLSASNAFLMSLRNADRMMQLHSRWFDNTTTHLPATPHERDATIAAQCTRVTSLRRKQMTDRLT